MSGYIRFDWAMKRLLRNKANFGVLEGFLTTLLNEKITIRRLLESESNQEDEYDKYNRVDMLAENSSGELFLIEVQNNNEYAYFQRMLFGASKLVTEYINRGEGYHNVRKVYSINIVYFSLGSGRDTVYHGKTEFHGIHTGDILELSPFQKQKFNADAVSELYPEYYILKVNDFDKVATTPLDEWIYYLNTGEVPTGATAPGLDDVRERLKLDRMTKDELSAYYRHLDNVVILRDNIITEREEGRAEGLAEGIEKGRVEGIEKGRVEGIEKGRAEGREEGRTEGIMDIARGMKADGLSVGVIAKYTGLSSSEIEKL
ncbi:Rpn family recombination-promoting nuclease/putative transposase [Xylanibacter muris]|uniref:Rpn family recombination-promoting nuclease/putative transposase n=2 Tax=Xylanibacter muris TaxID=2736290 RepID=A0ABX2APK0_9BACT|nr:Rpn family recombination-promoting nuclease/putative transposase [Xylanibacter muris]NPD93173.1 Rpn family recombination-promoting nuclease/putative transposase [Xylanibacter muris]